MKIGVQTIKSQKYYIDVEETDTILSVKQKLSSVHGIGAVEEQKLIYVGKVLRDEQTIADAKIKANDLLVVMVSKAKKSAGAPAESSSASSAPSTAAAAQEAASSATPASSSPAAAAPAPAPVAAPAPAPTPAAAPTPAPTSTPASTASASLSSAAASSMVMGQGYEDMVLNLMALGFDRDQVVRALRAAFNSPDRAAEYLFTGIPPSALAAADAAERGAPSSAAAQAAPSAAAQAASGGNAGGAAAAAGAGGAASAAVANLAANVVNAAGGAGGLSNLDPATVNNLRSLLQANPALLPQLLQTLSQSHPEMIQQLQQNPQQLEQILGPLAAGGGGARARQHNVQLTQEEKTQIDNLVALGFSREASLEAWLICERNFELAANFLFEHGEGGASMMEDIDAMEHDGGGDGGGGGEEDEDDENYDEHGYYE